LAKIALALEQAIAERAMNGAPGRATPRVLGSGEGWTVSDVLCTSGPVDRSFEEQHSHVSIAMVVAGSFQYRCQAGRALMTPGSLLLGNVGEYFECGHEHGVGDRCVAFHYRPDYFENLVASFVGSNSTFRVPRLPPQRPLSALVARACADLAEPVAASWEELSALLAARVGQLVSGVSPGAAQEPPGAIARVTRVVRMIERHPDMELDLAHLAREARLSLYHFLRSFERLTGVTPHQYVLRTRLREASLQLLDVRPPRAKILEIALACGFGDVSNFNRCFRAEFGVSPREYRLNTRRAAYIGSQKFCNTSQWRQGEESKCRCFRVLPAGPPPSEPGARGSS
jgi:AraC-like DNA-binding protein